MSTAKHVVDMEGETEGADGHEEESGLEAALAASRRAEAKSAQVLSFGSCGIRLIVVSVFQKSRMLQVVTGCGVCNRRACLKTVSRVG